MLLQRFFGPDLGFCSLRLRRGTRAKRQVCYGHISRMCLAAYWRIFLRIRRHYRWEFSRFKGRHPATQLTALFGMTLTCQSKSRDSRHHLLE